MVRFVMTGRPKYPPDCGELRPIGAVAAEVVGGIAVRAASRWLWQADQLTGKDRISCLETADAIQRKAGLRRVDIVPGKAA